ncbi:MAG: hypothetical protein ACKVWV_05610 [Planctomycetota bacterium]
MTSSGPTSRDRVRAAIGPVIWIIAILAIVLRRPVLFGASAASLSLFTLYLAFYVVVPGVLAYLCLRRRDDWLTTLGMGWTLGFAAQALVYVGLKIARLDALFPYFAAVNVPLAWLAWRARGSESAIAAPANGHVHPIAAVLLLAVIALAIQRLNLYPIQPLHWFPHPDLLFHAGNAAELANNFPLFDPRFAGDRLTYHFFSYAFAAGAHQVAGIPALDFLGCVGAPAMIALLALQVFNAGRLFSARAAGGLLAAALVVFQTDFGYDPSAFRTAFNNMFNHGVYNSVTTCPGLVLVAAIAIELWRWFRVERVTRGAALVLFVLGFTASGVKGSVMPVVVAGAFAALVFTWARDKPQRGRALSALLLLGCSAVPMTAYLSLAPDSYASTMFHFAPALVVETSSSFPWIAERLGFASGAAPKWLALALTPLWIAGYLALIGFAVLTVPRARRSTWGAPEYALLGVAASGLLLAWALAAPGQSQLFFLDNGQLALAILASGSVLLCKPARITRIAALAVAIALATPLATGTWQDVALQLERDRNAREPRPPPTQAALETIAWLREHTPTDAILVRRKPDLLLSAFAERRCFYETELHRPQHHVWGWEKSGGSPYVVNEPSPVGVERDRLQRRFMDDPSADTLRELRAAALRDAPIYVIYDQFEGRYNARRQIFVAARPLDTRSIPANTSLLELEYESRTARVYRVREP